jgi:hypothetical protein
MRAATPLLAAVAAAALASSAAAAPCRKPRQLKLRWDSASGQAQLISIAYGCPLPASCSNKEGELATRMPLQVSLRSGETTVFKTDLRPCDEPRKCQSLNHGGCAGGADAHKAGDGMVKFAFLRRGIASVTVRAQAAAARPPETRGPVTVAVSDAGGYSVEATFAHCRSIRHESGASLLCR